ncbi:MAG: N-acetyltransferase [Clostridia bacterium]|nr:N-acetyltransferase [Deltaproteobacteria bacterium]
MLTVNPVTNKADRDTFIKFPWIIYSGDSRWVPPLLIERKEFLDEKKNPFFEFATVQHYLARKDGKVVGRISAIDDKKYNDFHQVKNVGFGLFESVDDVEVSRALFAKVAEWGQTRGLENVWGPVSFSTNHECGLLVDGFDDMPAVMMSYNPTYYAKLIEDAGFAKARDLWAWHLPATAAVPEKVGRIAEKIREREGIVVRSARMDKWEEELDLAFSIYNESWEKNWGFVPFSKKEFYKLGNEMKMIVKPDLVLIAEVKGEVAGFSFTIPDVNPAQAKANGRLLPFGLIKMLLAMKKCKRVRLVLLGMRPGFRKRGIDAILYKDTLTNAAKLGFTQGEIGWTLDNNAMVNRAIESMGGKKSKTYRVYEKAVA